MHHPTDRIAHTTASRGTLAGKRNSSVDPPRKIDPTTHRTISERSYNGATCRSPITKIQTRIALKHPVILDNLFQHCYKYCSWLYIRIRIRSGVCVCAGLSGALFNNILTCILFVSRRARPHQRSLT